jgi:hypothetical protein
MVACFALVKKLNSKMELFGRSEACVGHGIEVIFITRLDTDGDC